MKNFICKNNSISVNGILGFDGDKIIVQNEDDIENKVCLKDLVTELDSYPVTITFKKNEIIA